MCEFAQIPTQFRTFLLLFFQGPPLQLQIKLPIQFQMKMQKSSAVQVFMLLGLLTAVEGFIVMEAGNSLINTFTYYTVTITDDNSASFDSTGWTIVTFPTSDYESSTVGNSECNVTCSKSGTNYNLSNSLFSFNTLMFNITNILNPGRAGGRDFSYSIYNSAGVLTDQFITSTLTFTPGSLQSCSVSFLPNNVRRIGTSTITITPGNPILVGGNIVIRFPKAWSSTINSDQPINTSTLTCTQVNGSIITSMSCSLLINGSDYFVTFSSPWSTDMNSSFSFTVNPVMSIPISYNSNQVSIYTQDSIGNLIDKSTNCSTSPPGANSFTLNLTTSTTTMVSKSFAPTFSFRASDLISSGDTLRITLPSEISFLNASLTASLNDSGVTTTRSLIYDSTNSNTTSYFYSISFSLPNSRTYASANSTVTLSNILLFSPPTTKPSGSIVLSLFRNSYIYSTGSVSLTAVTNTLSSVSLTAATYTVNRQTTYNLSFTTASPLSSTGSVTVQLPTTVVATDYTSKSCSIVGSINISSSGSCSMSSRLLTVSSAFTGLVPASSTFSVVFDGVANPESTSPTSVFRINTYYDSSTAPTYSVDTSSVVTLTATADTVVSYTVTPASYVVNAPVVYTIVYTLTNRLPIGGYVLIGLPIGMSLQTPNSATVMVSINGSTPISNTPTIVSTATSVYSSALNFTGLASSTALAAGTIVTFQISNIINPNSMKPSNSFSVYSFLQGFLIESLTSGVTVTMTTPASFTLVSVTANSQKNGDQTFYRIQIMPSLTIPSNSILQVVIPSTVTLTSPTCSNISTTNSLTCNYTSNILSILLSGADLLSTSVYNYQVNGFTNPRTMTTTAVFQVSCLSSQNFLIIQGNAPGISNTVPNNIMTLTSSVTDPVQSYLNSTQTIKFTITTKNPLMSTDFILLSYPSVYTYTGVIPTTDSICSEPSSNYNCIPLTTNNLTVKITGNWNNQTSFSFHVKNYRSPSLMQYINMTTYFLVYTKQVDQTDIDVTDPTNSATQTTFTISCSSNCQTCSTPITNCTSCYSGTITNNQFLQNTVCVSICATGNYSDSVTGLCKACVSPCQTCISEAVCLSCLSTVVNKFFDSTKSTCVSTCPTGYYGSVDVCVPCSSICLTCSGASTTCTSCNSTYLLYNSSCITACPKSYYNASGICLACDVSCLTCSGSATFCLTCQTGYVTNGTAGVCTNTCSVGTVPYLGSCSCLVSCLTCSGTFNNCLTCDPNSIVYRLFYANSCVGSCPTSTYQNSGSCTACTTGCSVCSSAQVCSACSTGYFLHNLNCLTSCPSGTYVSGSACLNCTSPCATCQNLATNCTTCTTGTSLEGRQCVASCSTGSISISTTNGSVCTTCTPNCSTCSGSLTNCTSCISSSATSLLNGQCLASCPTGTTSVLSKCQLCNTPCLTCNVTTTNCLTCLSSFYRVGQTVVQCVSNCSSVGLFANGTDCITCQSPCSSCNNTATNCTSCISTEYLLGNSCVTSCGSGFYGYQGNCITSCPNGTVPSGTTCADPNNTNNTNSTTQNLTNTLESSKIIPFPFLIADFLVVGLTIISKFSAPETCMPAMAISFGSILEFFSWVIVLLVIGLKDSKLYVFRRLLFTTQTLTSKGVLFLLVGGAVHYILNLVNFIFYLKYITPDPAYQKWLKTPANSRTHKATLALSFLITYKFSNLPFSKCFGSQCFKAPLSKPIVYTPMNIISGIGFSVSILMIVGCGLIIYDSTTTLMSSLFIQSIDVIVVTTLILIFSVWNFFKPEEFFDADSKFNTASDEIYNDTLANMINNQSQFGERLSINEAEQGKVGNRNYSRMHNESKMSKISNRAKDPQGILIHNEGTHNSLNIHENSSDYVSEENNQIEGIGQLPKYSKTLFKDKEGEAEQGKSSIIDKIRQSSEFEVQNDDGLQAINPDAFKKKSKKSSKKKSPGKQGTGNSDVDSPKKSGGIFNKHNKVAPLIVNKNQKIKKQTDEDAPSLTSSEIRMKQNEIQWEDNGKKRSQKKSASKGKNKSKSKDKRTKNITISDKEGLEVQDGQRYGTDQQRGNSPNLQIRKSPKNAIKKSKSPKKQKDSSDNDDSLPRGLSQKKNKGKTKIKNNSQAINLSKQKSLNITKSNKKKQGELQVEIDSIDLDEIVPSIPSELPTIAFPQSGSQDPRSQTIDAGSPKNKKKFGRKARNPHNQKVFSALNNTSMVKDLDLPDEVPNKPILNTHKSNQDFEKPKQTKIDDQFINKYYNDEQSLKSVQDANIQFNEISPSEFNVQNQRFESSLDFAHPKDHIEKDIINKIPEKGVATESQRDDPYAFTYYDTVSNLGSEGKKKSRSPQGLSPEQKHQLPPVGINQPIEFEQYKNFQRIDSIGYDGVYQKVGGSQTQLNNNKKLRDLEKIYLQRLDFKNDNKRKTTNSAFNKKYFLDEP